MYAIKVGRNGEFDHVKARLVAKEYTQYMVQMEKSIGCRWVYAIKVGPNGEVNCLRARPQINSPNGEN